jgi:tRNA threonylcarbamoyladenosine biosynthesis protein TsaE
LINEIEPDYVYEFLSSSEAETNRLGLAFGDALAPGLVVGLNGPLGSGKTRLTQAIGTSLGIPNGEVVSPTFTICVPHEGRLPFVHLDAYRIAQPEEVDELGLDELAEDGVVLIIEWADRIKNLLPACDVDVWITTTDTETRQFRFLANTNRGHQLIRAMLVRLGAASEN